MARERRTIMFRVKVEDIQKIKPDFKEQMIVNVLFAHNIGNGELADILVLTNEEAIQVNRNSLMLLQSSIGYLNLEDELIACHECCNSFAENKYSFVLVPVKEESNAKTVY